MPRFRLLSLNLCLSLLLAGCMQLWPGSLYTLSPLHITGLRHLPGLARILDSAEEGGLAATPFQASGDTALRVLLNVGGKLVVANMDGSGERSLTTTTPCAGAVTVTPDGEWAACLAVRGDDRLDLVALAPGATQHYEFHLPSGSYYGLAWSPDGSRLALVDENYHVTTRSIETTSSIEVYAISADHRALTLVALVTSEVFASYGPHNVRAVGWTASDAGTQRGPGLEIAVRSMEGPSLPQGTLLVDEHVVLPPATEVTQIPVNVAVPSTQFTVIPDATPTSPFRVSDAAWNPQMSLLALISSDEHSDGHVLRYAAMPARRVGSWFAISDAQHVMGHLAWTPNGRQLLLIVHGPLCVDTCAGRALPDVYLYTLPAAS